MKKDTILFSWLIMAFLFFKCSSPASDLSSDPIPEPPDIPIETLLSAPDTLVIENQHLVLSTYMWRDFQPVSPPDGKPLISLVYIETVDSSLIDSSINAEVIYIVHNNLVWKSFFTEEKVAQSTLESFRITKIAREGPKWGPNVYVDVIIRIKVKNNYLLLRASEQCIERTD